MKSHYESNPFMSMLRNGLRILVIGAAAFTISCGPPAERHELEGKVVSVDVEAGKVTLAHQEISGLMDAMTMPFNVPDRKLLPSIQEGDTLRAILVVRGNAHWLEELVVSRAGASGSLVDAMTPSGPELGSAVPDIELVNQDGEAIRISDYRGKALLLTFIYTRCPLVEFCPRMNKHFAVVEQTLEVDPLYERTHLLSISFDPEFDTPELLKTFALQQPTVKTATLSHWEFASGTHENLRAIGFYLGLTYREAEDQIVHNLRTAFVAPDGTLAKLYLGNDWKPEEVVSDVREFFSREGSQ